MASASVTSKGQITIPAEVREKMRLHAGSRVAFIENEDGDFVLKAKTGSLSAVKGMFKWTGKPVSIEEMNETIRKGWAGQLKYKD
jgi:antitoxin PrlF